MSRPVLAGGGVRLAQGMRFLNATYSQYFNRKHRLVGHAFQGMDDTPAWLDIATVLALFDAAQDAAIVAYKAFVMEGLGGRPCKNSLPTAADRSWGWQRPIYPLAIQ